jgi:hypothetical protein
MNDTRLPFDDFQRDVLDALGLVVYRTEPPPVLMQAIALAANASVASVARLPKLPSLEQLRTPAAKRALWPQLRALRKAPRA